MKPVNDESAVADMTPMIDVVFLLLIFFLLTTTFVPEELVISNLLPTEIGDAAAPADLIERSTVHITVLPDGIERGLDAAAYQAAWQAGYSRDRAQVVVGAAAPYYVDGVHLQATQPHDKVAMVALHEHLHGQLMALEHAGQPRDEQDPIVIHCFSGLAWKYALATYDAVRSYEQGHVAAGGERKVSFAPPPRVTAEPLAIGYELARIAHVK
ncbi:MAG: biopolymer transporter ExbD [Planctomycetota bacterium]|jgi:hypothetical protein